MSWEARKTRRYYYLAERRSGATVKRYIGRGPAGELAEAIETQARRERARAAEGLRVEQIRSEPAEQAAMQFDAVCVLMLSASLYAVGFRRNRSGPWRKRRDVRVKN